MFVRIFFYINSYKLFLHILHKWTLLYIRIWLGQINKISFGNKLSKLIEHHQIHNKLYLKGLIIQSYSIRIMLLSR